MENSNVLLESERVSKCFGQTHACNSISLRVYKGEIHGLIGENGSGKSTFTSIVSGLYTQDDGKLYFEGREYHAKSRIQANTSGITAVAQEAGTLDGLTVAENMFLGNEDSFITHGFLNRGEMNRKAGDILNRFGLNKIKAADMVDQYDFETRKLIEIVKAVYPNPKLVIIDETTTALSQDGREFLYKVMDEIRNSGNSVIFISHDLDEVINKCQRISVLRDGEFITTVTAKDSDVSTLKELMVGRKIDGNYYRTDYDSLISGKVVLSANIVKTKGSLHDISFDLHQGEILGIGGLSDCGIHEIGKVLFGAECDVQGFITNGSGKRIDCIKTAIKEKIAYISKDRDKESIILNASIKDNICLMAYDRLKTHGFISNEMENKFSRKNSDQLSIKMQNIDQNVSALSGGNKQKVALARWISITPDIFILDSPTRGIDIKVKADIYQLMDELRKEGKSIVVISEEIMELIGMCDRILVLKDGHINGEFSRSRDLREQNLIAKMV